MITPLNKFKMQYFDYEVTEKSKSVSISLDEITPEISSVWKVEFVDVNGEEYICDYRFRRNNIEIVIPYIEGTITIMYNPKIKILTQADFRGTYDNEENDGSEDKSIDLKTLGISDDICQAVIPYLVKSVLWQDIEPELAQLEFQKGMQNINLMMDSDNNEPYQTSVINVNSTHWM